MADRSARLVAEAFSRRMIRVLLAGAAGVAGTGTAVVSAEAPAVAAAPPLYSPDNDPKWAQPYVDVDEWRDAPVRHRYVHGGFRGTETRFSFYFPPKEQYQGHFFQHITPIPDDENLAQKAPLTEDNKIAAAIEGGAYFIETNGGGRFDIGKGSAALAEPSITAFKANAAAAAYSRVVAQKVYDTSQRPFGYAYGGSGGAFRTIGSFENTTGVWDGAVPYVMGSNMAIPNMFTWRLRTLRVLGPKLDQVVDAASPGGSGDIYAGLTPLEADVLREATAMGIKPETWFGWRTMGIHGFAALYQGVVAADPTYFTEFWTQPGYLGHDHPEQFEGARLQFSSSIAQPITAADAARARINLDASSEHQRGGVDTAFKIPAGAQGQRVAAFRLAGPPPAVTFLGGDLIVKTGAAAGKRLPLARIIGDIVVLGFADSSVAARIAPGDEVAVDNSNFLAMETYERHQVPPLSEGYYVWDQFRNADGTPKYPQRPRLIGPGFVKATGGSIQTGRWQGKMIVVESLWDREALPWQADWYRNQVRKHQGDRIERNYRLWYTDHALHGDSREQINEDPSRIVSYVPILNQALRDISAWVEKGTPPSPSTQYRIADGQVVVPPTAALRRGIQPVVTVRANGGQRADVRVGQPVTLTGTIEVPPGAGSVVGAEWDFDGAGAFPTRSQVPKGATRARVAITHSFAKPGTYFPALRGASQRQSTRQTPYTRIENIGRARVVVR
ncbi:MAG: hypothetical protein ABIT04_01910 [Novosphingobium sp.]